MTKSKYPVRFFNPKTKLYYVLFDTDMHKEIEDIITKALGGQIISVPSNPEIQSVVDHYKIHDQVVILSTSTNPSIETAIGSSNVDVLGAIEDILDSSTD